MLSVKYYKYYIYRLWMSFYFLFFCNDLLENYWIAKINVILPHLLDTVMNIIVVDYVVMEVVICTSNKDWIFSRAHGEKNPNPWRGMRVSLPPTLSASIPCSQFIITIHNSQQRNPVTARLISTHLYFSE